MMHIYRECTAPMLSGITMRTTKRKQLYNGWVLLLFTTAFSVSGDEGKNTARQLLDGDRDAGPVCVFSFLTRVFSHQRPLLLWMSISLSERVMTEPRRQRWGSSKHTKMRMWLSDASDAQEGRTKRWEGSHFDKPTTSVVHICLLLLFLLCLFLFRFLLVFFFFFCFFVVACTTFYVLIHMCVYCLCACSN